MKELVAAPEGDVTLLLPDFKSATGTLHAGSLVPWGTRSWQFSERSLKKRKRRDNDPDQDDWVVVRILASSEALCAASPVFDRMLMGNKVEATTLRDLAMSRLSFQRRTTLATG